MKSKPNVLLIAIDSLLSTHMSCYGYHRQTTPHIDAFAKKCVLFDRNFSAHIPTTSAYASMLTGRDAFGTNCVALRHKGDLAPNVPTLAEILGGEGYDTLCVGFSKNPAGRGFQRYLDYSAWGSLAEGASRKAESLNAAFLPELRKLAAAKDRPFFVMLRHMDPHSPYLPPEPFAGMFYQSDPRDPAKTSMEPIMAFRPFADYFRQWIPEGVTDAEYVVAQYDGAIAYMDSCIQQIFTALDELGLAEDTIVVLNGDHGETLNDHECYFDHHGLYDVTLKVPLMIRAPGLLPANQHVDGYVQHKDLVPTILELAGFEPTVQFDGRSLLPMIRGEVPSHESSFYITECTWMRKHGWRTPEWKLIVALEPDIHFKPPVELYNLITDPGENSNVADQFPHIVTALRTEMDAHIAARTKATGRPNPIENQPGWHGKAGIDYFTSSQQAYDSLHIGSVSTATRLQADAKNVKAPAPSPAPEPVADVVEAVKESVAIAK
ncbi:MAG: sulfatase [Candidatus Methylacidiphilales bacterium]|nr:sulfatase [Candidatus Methylacidiphilales bacterium]